MPKPKAVTPENPEALEPFKWHKVIFNGVSSSGNHAIGNCPFCGREDKFGVTYETGMWKCFICQEGSAKGGGNIYTFLNLLHEQCLRDTTTAQYERVAKERNIEDIQFLKDWGLAFSSLSDNWLIPGYNVEGKLNQLYRWVPCKDKKGHWKKRILPTPTLGHGLHGLPLIAPAASILILCEGFWDGVRLSEVLALEKQRQSRGLVTGPTWIPEASVIALPGCGAVGSSLRRWGSIFSGKEVILVFDNDHPRPHPKTGELMEPAGWGAARRATSILASMDTEAISVIQWGEDGHDPELSDGHDVRDFLQEN